MAEPRYTLQEAHKILAESNCKANGHDWEILEAEGVGPVSLLCSRCGASRRVIVDG